MATKIKAHNLHTDVKAILDSKATTTQLAAKADISALAGKADSDTVVAALANKLTAVEEYTFFGLRTRVAEAMMFDNSIWFSGPYEYFDQQISHGIKDSDFDLIFYTMGDFATGRGGDVRFTHPAAGYGATGKTHLLIDKNDDFAVVTSGHVRLVEDSRSITLGADSDFTITHDGTNNIINSIGPGDLFIQDAGVNKLALDANGIIVYGSHRVVGDVTVTGAIQSTASGTPTITSASNIIFNADSGNGIINFSGSKIINIANPIDSQDAASKSYVDSANYKDSDVDTHLNTSTATVGEVLSWSGTDYNWVSQSGGASGGSTTVNTLYVDSDIKIMEQGSILTRYPAVEFEDPYSPGTIRSYPERIYYEQKVDVLGISGIMFGMIFQPFDIWSKPKTDVSSVELTIHISTYPMPASGPDPDTLWSTTFSNSQIIQGHIIHDDDSDATFTITSNVCTTPNTNIAVIAATMAGGSNLRLTANLASPELLRIVVHSKFARKYDVTPYG